MATRAINRITGITGVIQGGIALLRLEVGPRYHAIKFTTKINGVRVVATAVIDWIRVKVNETTIRELTAAELIAINQLNGITTTLGDLGLFFSEPGRADKVDEEATAWQTAGERSFTIEIKVKTLALPGDQPLIEAEAIFDMDKPTRNGKLVKNIIRHTGQAHALAAGTNNLTTLETSNPLLRILLTGPSAISEVEVKADSFQYFESGVFENTQRLKDYGMDATAFTFPIVFDYTERLDHFLVVSKTLNVKVVSAAVQDIRSITEFVTDGF